MSRLSALLLLALIGCQDPGGPPAPIAAPATAYTAVCTVPMTIDPSDYSVGVYLYPADVPMYSPCP
jgi:hypothetical protein